MSTGARVTFKLDGETYSAPSGFTIWEAAAANGVEIPRLCHRRGMKPIGVCRACAVEVEGSRTLVASCMRPVEAGMVIGIQSQRALRAQRTIVGMLVADLPSPAEGGQGPSELFDLAARLGIGSNPSHPSQTCSKDLSSPVIAVDLSTCILCDRCIHACNDVQSNDVIGRAGRGPDTRIVFDSDLPMGESSCVSCGECVAACPTDALTNKPIMLPLSTNGIKKVDSVCPYCGVGCGMTYHVREDTIVEVTGIEEAPPNLGRLCVKGRYGYDYVHHPDRLKKPLIRKEGAPKTPELPAEPRALFREVEWEEALDFAASRLKAIREAHGSSALGGFGSAKCSNEDNYIFQKFVRAALGTNNVDHCARLCHSSSVVALMESIGSGAVSNIFAEALESDVIIVAGSNTTENHPVAATFIKEAAKKGAQLIVVDPRRIDLVDHANLHIQFQPGTDVALFNGLINVVIKEGLIDPSFIENRTLHFDAVAASVKPYTPATVAKLTGVPAAIIRRVARSYSQAERAIIFWGMGLTQHTHGTDNVRALISFCLLCGQIGRRGTGLHPLRGQNNVQGCSDMGVLPNVLPGYQGVADEVGREKFEKNWGAALNPEPGLTIVELLNAALNKQIRGLYFMGENAALSDPNLNHTRECLAALDFLAVQDIFLTETATYADVVFPTLALPEKVGTCTNTDRRVQLARRTLDPPGESREDWRVICEVSSRMGYSMSYESSEEIFSEMARLTPSYAGIRYSRLEKCGIVWPCPEEGHPGTETLFTERFPVGKARLAPVEFAPAKELPNRRFPFILNTGRNLYHWHTGTMTRRSKALEALEPEAYAEISGEDYKRLRLREGDQVRVRSRRGEIVLFARVSPRVRPSQVFIPFHYAEAAANLLTTDALDPYSKIPGYKFCAVRVEPLK
jgi:formate dehydrogenase major subunit